MTRPTPEQWRAWRDKPGRLAHELGRAHNYIESLERDGRWAAHKRREDDR